MKRALLSVSDKTNIALFAKSLIGLGYQIISTGGTYKLLREEGIDAIEIDEVTKFPECFEGRVKTLNPYIHGGILHRRDKQSHLDQAKKLGVEAIDLVCVNLYPFKATIEKTDDFEEIIENIDIGGPAMIRAAAKNHAGVTVVVDPKSLPYLEGTELDFTREGLNEGFRFRNPNVKDECGCGESFNV